MGRGIYLMGSTVALFALCVGDAAAAPMPGDEKAEAVALYRGARALQKTKQCRPALKRAERALALFEGHQPPLPKHVARVQTLRARCARDLKNYKLLLAIEQARLQSASADAEFPPLKLGYAYQRAANAHVNLKEYDLALPLYDSALEAYRRAPSGAKRPIALLLGWRGKALLNAGRTQMAVPDLKAYTDYARRAYKDSPTKLSGALSWLKTAYRRMKAYDQALAVLSDQKAAYEDRSIKFKETLLGLHVERVELLSNSGQLEKATAELKVATKKGKAWFKPDNKALGGLAVAEGNHCLKTKDYACSKRAAERGVRIYSKQMTEQGIGKGQVRSARRGLTAALICLHKALRKLRHYELQIMTLRRIAQLQTDAKSSAWRLGHTYSALTEALTEQSRYDECQREGQKALDLFNKSKQQNPSSRAGLHFRLAKCARRGGVADDDAEARARAHLRRAATLFEQADRPRNVGRSLIQLARSLMRQENFHEVLHVLEDGCAAARRVNDHGTLVLGMTLQSEAHGALGAKQDELRVAQEAARIAKKHRSKPKAFYKDALRRLAAAYEAQDRFAEARRVKLQLVKLAKKTGGVLTGLVEAAHQGVFFFGKGDQTRAEEQVQKFMDGIYEKVNPDSYVGRVAISLQIGRYVARGKGPEARALIEVALEGTYYAKASKKERAELHGKHAELLLLEGKPAESQMAIQRAYAQLDASKRPPGNVLRAHARVLIALGKYREAHETASQLPTQKDPTLQVPQIEMVTAYQAGLREEALETAQRVLAKRESTLGAQLMTGTDDERRMAVQEMRLFSEWLITVALDSGSPGFNRLAAELALNTRGRTLEALRESKLWLARDGNDTARELVARIRTRQNKLSQWSLRMKKEPKRAQRAMRKIATELAELQDKVASILEGNPGVSSALKPDQVTELLPNNGSLLAYFPYRPYGSALFRKYVPRESSNLPHRFAVLVLTKNEAPAWYDLGEAALINAEVKALRNSLANRNGSYESASRRLREMLLPARITGINKQKQLLLMPGGRLNLVPFAALTMQDGRFLAETHTLRYLSSSRDLIKPGPGRTTSAPLIFANPEFGPTKDATKSAVATRTGTEGFTMLQGTHNEALAIQTTLGLPRDRLQIGATASESALYAAKSPIILHIATHGFFTPRKAISKTVGALSTRRALNNPMLNSGIALAGANHLGDGTPGNDGVLTALEAVELHLDETELVVLSACETGLGTVDSGEGVYGLKRALSIAGARSQAVTLWKVDDDATAALMAQFYDRLKSGEDRVDALRQVQIDMLKGRLVAKSAHATDQRGATVAISGGSASKQARDWRHPYYWASFTLSGADGAIQLSRP